MTFTPFSGFDPMDGAEPNVTLSRGNPVGVDEMAEHTPGPWAISRKASRRVTNLHGVVICNAVLRNQGGPKHKTSMKSEAEAEANARRIVACVNALEGIPNPAAFVAHYREMVGALEKWVHYDGNDHADGMGIMIDYADALAATKAALAKAEELGRP